MENSQAAAGKPVSQKQITFFEQLLGEKQLPEDTNRERLLEQFKGLNKKSASIWIDRMMDLPDSGEVIEDVVQAPF